MRSYELPEDVTENSFRKLAGVGEESSENTNIGTIELTCYDNVVSISQSIHLESKPLKFQYLEFRSKCTLYSCILISELFAS